MGNPFSPICQNHYFVPTLIFILCFRLSPSASATDTISSNQTLSGDQTLLSSGENFVLGYFRPGNSSYYYIGIWYQQISSKTIVWVANRDNPVVDKNATRLRILDGNLVLTNDSKSPAWSTNLTGSSGEVVAVLGDDGNLIIKSGSNSSSAEAPLWQSFDYPAHTWLPGAKLGINKRTNKTTLLTSWKNSDDPAVGLFSLQLQPSSEYFIFWNMSDDYWTSGTWDNQSKIFSLVPEMRLNYIYDFSYVDNENESYFTYSVYKSANTVSRFVMDLSGQIKQLSWLPTQQWNLFWSQPRQQCEVYRLCGPYGVCSESTDNFCSCLHGFSIASPNDWNLSDWSAGCARKTGLNCGVNATTNKDKDRFFPMSSVKLPDSQQSKSVGSSSECENYCSSNCSCTGYTFQDGSCLTWGGDLFNLWQLSTSDQSGKNFYLRLAASDVPNPSSKPNVAAIVGGSVAGVIALVGIALLGLWAWKRRSTRTKTVEGTLIAFAYRDVQAATKNFSEKLGGGGFGSVFKGTLPDSSEIAVKKLESISQGEKQFRTEVSTIGMIQHVNLVRLRGFCSEGDKKLLVYDYMPNGSLNAHLFNGKDSNILDWKTRYQIALGTARGLTYLHEKCRDCIIHCDIKPENILLDAEFVPKVADFGLAKLMGREFSRVLTTMRGTRGYLAPEWISGVAITAKADVYSYGMMLFEIVSGRRNSEPDGDSKIKFFPTWAASKLVEGGDLLDLLDPSLGSEADLDELSKICRVACWCIQDEEVHRPTMGQVVQILEGVLEVNMPPIPRALQLYADNQEQIVFFTESSSSQSSQTRSNNSASTVASKNQNAVSQNSAPSQE
ncbi:hypothetical protein MLD38_029296 [Melastoma candidum]|uniref:Uncharacterized protein n=1 Tax=Melastoma candidum TaxID=119954 RepID=A0ACB9N3P3_9MYRT|nr:hypothetical protein MLD38_029296 [Melastoma candidum]